MENAGKFERGWKDFLMPSWGKIAIFLVLSFISYPLYIYSITFIDYVGKNAIIQRLGIALNIVPLIILRFSGPYSFKYKGPSIVDDFLLVFNLLLLPLLWYYFLTCLIVWIHNKFKIKERLFKVLGSYYHFFYDFD